MVSSFGWTSWGWADGRTLGSFRVWKHHTGQLIAVPDGHPEPFLLLMHLNEWLEDEAGIEREPDEAAMRAEAREQQTVTDMAQTCLRLEAENAELRRRLDERVP